jgi:plastocyanin
MTHAACIPFLLLVLAAAAPAADVVGTLTAGGKPIAGAVVYLESISEATPAATPPRLVMDQKNLAFVPGVLPVARGTTVEFTNSDDVEHNVFSPSEVKAFDLGTYRRSEKRSVLFDRPGEVLVLCNIHMEMAAKILVLRDPYFTRTSVDGGYHLAAVPAGTYTVRVWRNGWTPDHGQISLAEGERRTVDLALDR